jgi:hypothetical protein
VDLVEAADIRFSDAGIATDPDGAELAAVDQPPDLRRRDVEDRGGALDRVARLAVVVGRGMRRGVRDDGVGESRRDIGDRETRPHESLGRHGRGIEGGGEQLDETRAALFHRHRPRAGLVLATDERQDGSRTFLPVLLVRLVRRIGSTSMPARVRRPFGLARGKCLARDPAGVERFGDEQARDRRDVLM